MFTKAETLSIVYISPGVNTSYIHPSIYLHITLWVLTNNILQVLGWRMHLTHKNENMLSPSITEKKFICKIEWLMNNVKACNRHAGDSGYPANGLVPQPLRNRAECGTEKIRGAGRAHSVVERIIGFLKSWRRCLDKYGGTRSYKPEKVSELLVFIPLQTFVYKCA